MVIFRIDVTFSDTIHAAQSTKRNVKDNFCMLNTLPRELHVRRELIIRMVRSRRKSLSDRKLGFAPPLIQFFFLSFFLLSLNDVHSGPPFCSLLSTSAAPHPLFFDFVTSHEALYEYVPSS